MQGETLESEMDKTHGVASEKAVVGEGGHSRNQGMRDMLMEDHGEFFASSRLSKHGDRR